MNEIKKVFKSIYLPFIILGIILLYIHIPISKCNDDVWFQNVLNDQSLFDFLISRYNQWTSRIFIETILVTLSNTHVSIIIWKILNILMFELLAYSIFKIFIYDIKDKNNKLTLTWLLMFGLLTIPLAALKDAGWIATTTNYLWTLSLGMFVFTLLKKSLNQEKIKWYDAILYIFATIYAANQEQMAAVLLAIFTLYIIYLIKNKELKQKINKTTILVYSLIIISFLFILTCPGNDVRVIQETKTWFPEHEYIGFFNKIQLGITSMMKFFVNDIKLVFILLTIVMTYYIFKEYKNVLYRIVSTIPVIVSIFFVICRINLVPGISNLMSFYFKNELVINQTNMYDFKIYIPMIIYILILFCIFINICLIFKNTTKGLLVIVIYGLGLVTRLILGFSPTVFASNERPSLFLYFSFVLITLLIFKKMLKDNKYISNIQKIYIMGAIVNFVIRQIL